MNEKNNSELAKEYKRSLQLITDRIEELKMKKKELEAKLKTNDKVHIGVSKSLIEIENRLRPLLQIQRNVREIGIEVNNYYERSWWRSEKYTLNTRKSRRIVPAIFNVFEEQVINELITDNGDERITL